MKKFFNPMPAGGAPIYTDALNEVISQQIHLGMQSTMNALSDVLGGIIVDGGAITDNGDTTYNIAKGVAFFVNDGAGGDGGDYMEFAADTNLSIPFYINQSTPVIDTAEFADTVVRSFTETKSAIVSQVSGGVGAFIAINQFPVADHYYLETFIVNTFALQSTTSAINSVATDLAAHIALTSSAHSDSGKPVFIASVNSAGTAVAQYKKIGEPNWTVTKSGDGVYEVLRDGLVLGSNAVMIGSGSVAGTAFSSVLSAITIYATQTGALANSGCHFAVYILPT